HHESAVPDDIAPDAGNHVRTARAQRELAEEQRRRPRPGRDLRLDPHHAAQMPAPHPHDVNVELLGERLRERHYADLRSCAISASLRRRYIGTTSAGAAKS